MSDNSKIEWTDATWNPLRGVRGKWHCTKVSPGCKNCYAERINKRFNGPAYKVGADTLRLDDKILEQPLRWRKPRMIFVCSMSDLFHEDAQFDWIAAIFGIMAACPQHTFQCLTKRPERARAFFDWLREERPLPEHGRGCHRERLSAVWKGWYHTEYRGDWLDVARGHWPLPNLWLGVSAEDQERANERIPVLLKLPAAVRFISAEPLLGSLDLTPWLGRRPLVNPARFWVIVGGESGPGARPMHPDWARSLRDQCVEAGVAFHFKQWGAFNAGVRMGKKKAGRILDNRTWDQFPQATA